MNRNQRMFVLKQKIELSESFNFLVWFIRRFPILGKFFGDKYNFDEPKQIIHTLYPIFAIIKQVIFSTLTFIFAISITNLGLLNLYDLMGSGFFLGNITDRTSFLNESYRHFAPLYFYISTGIFRNVIEDSMADIEKYYKNFHFSPEEIVKANIYYKPLLRFVARSMVFMLVFKIIANINPFYSLLASMSIFIMEIGASVFWLRHMLKYGETIFTNGFFQFFIILLLTIVLAYINLVLGLLPWVFMAMLFIFCLVLFISGYSYMKDFTSYGKIIEICIKTREVSLKDMEDVLDNQVRIREKDIEKKEIKARGFDYLNRLFFIRHKRILLKPVLIKTGIFAGILLILNILPLFLPKLQLDIIVMVLQVIVPIIMYTICKQVNIMTAFYVNCDQGLLPYGFYREPKNLLSMYRARFLSLLKINIVPTLVYILGFSVLFLRTEKFNIYKLVETNIYILMMGVFFTILPLGQYYLTQPFNSEGKRVGVLASVIDFAAYWLMYYLIVLASKIEIGTLALGTSALIVVFSILTSLLIVKIGPKTLKIRN